MFPIISFPLDTMYMNVAVYGVIIYFVYVTQAKKYFTVTQITFNGTLCLSFIHLTFVFYFLSVTIQYR